MKWCSLSYEEATWELQEDLDPEKIREFEVVQKLPTDLRHVVSRNIGKKIWVQKKRFQVCPWFPLRVIDAAGSLILKSQQQSR